MNSSNGNLPIRLRDTEVTNVPKALTKLEFCPGKTSLPRLDYEAAKFARWRVISVSVKYSPTCSYTTDGAVVYGIISGPPDSAIKTPSDVLKLRPFQAHSAWKTSRIVIPRNIQAQTFLYTSGSSPDHTAFTIYYAGPDDNKGMLQITYDVELSFPNP